MIRKVSGALAELITNIKRIEYNEVEIHKKQFKKWKNNDLIENMKRINMMKL
jgi:hypothetical protein